MCLKHIKLNTTLERKFSVFSCARASVWSRSLEVFTLPIWAVGSDTNGLFHSPGGPVEISVQNLHGQCQRQTNQEKNDENKMLELWVSFSCHTDPELLGASPNLSGNSLAVYPL